MDREIFVFGAPADCGGANSELWGLLRVLRRRVGAPVTLVPTWGIQPHWRRRVESLDCRILQTRRQNLSLPDGSICVALCNIPFLNLRDRLQNCRIIYAPCMTYLSEDDRRTHRQFGPMDAYVFQSRFQRDELLSELRELGVTDDRCRVIRGAFDATRFRFSPHVHEAGKPFYFGRLSRPDIRKIRDDWWDVCAAIGGVPWTMAWSVAMKLKCGTPPAIAVCVQKNGLPVQEYLENLHCLVQLGDVAENWPQCGLEAFAVGVPVVADNRGGWREMIEDGRTGFLARDSRQAVEYAKLLAHDEPLRLEIIERARMALEELVDEELLGQQWTDLINGVVSAR